MNKSKSRVAFYTLGCKLNQFESEVLADSFLSAGADIVPATESADIYIINTCTVTSKSEQKARRIIRKISRDFPGAIVVVTGCYAQLDPDKIEEIADNLLVIPQDKKQLLLKSTKMMLDNCIDPQDAVPLLKGFIEKTAAEESVSQSQSGSQTEKPADSSFYSVKKGYLFHSRAFLKIQDGCDNFCKYCRVPLARGRSRSLDPDHVISNIIDIEKSGYNELVLTGVNISSYKSGGFDLVSLIEKILADTQKMRIRLSSLEPDSIDERYLDIIKLDRICGHFHLPVQSGSDNILSAMGRKYKRDKVTDAVSILRQKKDNPMISADVITGFPGETDKDFEETCELVSACGFAYLHVFPYSPRPGTAAYKMKNHVPERISTYRAEQLRNLSEKLFASYASSCIGMSASAIIEGKEGTEENIWNGISGNYLKLKISGFPGGKNPVSGSIVSCVIKAHRSDEGNSFDALFESFG
ncbi:MAG: tRNA (N(6)-L-threonylcarbamoyladenosine(37)-C(2))-methylthiotransferase MtaB [Spirochaetia bacterium]|jgi:threonylcarbamoyladenosine tRNA methylthiotransferase MtaB|nr:tRNA (N(6)-L-threonylcarbamoyladenosine(37)-C(2))-methylthiotransferase MtaB [Spirochaetia bacterium]